MKDEVRKNFVDILQAAEEIQDFVEGIHFEKYQRNILVHRAVERNFEIIGEALNRIKREDAECLEKISEHHRIIGFRNILSHGYDVIDEAIVWKTITTHLPILVTEVKALLD